MSRQNNTKTISENITDIEITTQKLKTASSAIISDAMAKCLSKSLKFQTMESCIKPLKQSFKVCGPAYTVCCYPGATYAMEKAVAQAPADSVIVCDGQKSDAGVLMGGLMSLFAKERGIAGAVIDGAVRDIEDIDELNFPVFCRYVTPRAGTFDKIGDTQLTITCGSVVVNPGDFIFGDLNGVVVIPKDIVQEVSIASVGLLNFEKKIKIKLSDGHTLEEAFAATDKPDLVEI